MAELLFMWAISNLLNLQVWGPLAVQIIYPKSILDINHTQFCLFTGPLYIGVSSWKYSALYSVQNFRSIHSFDWLLWANESLQKFSLNKLLTVYIVMLLGRHSGQGRGYKTNLSCLLYSPLHDDVIKWKYVLCYWPFVRGIHRSQVNSPHKSQWRVALMFSFICAQTNSLANNGNMVDLRCHHTHHNAIVTIIELSKCILIFHVAVAFGR